MSGCHPHSTSTFLNVCPMRPPPPMSAFVTGLCGRGLQGAALQVSALHAHPAYRDPGSPLGALAAATRSHGAHHNTLRNSHTLKNKSSPLFRVSICLEPRTKMVLMSCPAT